MRPRWTFGSGLSPATRLVSTPACLAVIAPLLTTGTWCAFANFSALTSALTPVLSRMMPLAPLTTAFRIAALMTFGSPLPSTTVVFQQGRYERHERGDPARRADDV